jgi:hypothetical protein
LQDAKQPEPRSLTLRGITIDFNEEFENTEYSMCFNCEFRSNEIDESDRQDAKHSGQRNSTLRGITIDFNEEFENADDSMRLNCEFDSKQIDETILQ